MDKEKSILMRKWILSIWIAAVLVASILSGIFGDVIFFFKVTGSGVELHFIGYFVLSVLCYWTFKKDTLFYILFFGFLLFIIGVTLEVAQYYLPATTFNLDDIVANGLGILFFIVCWAVYRRFVKTKRNVLDAD